MNVSTASIRKVIILTRTYHSPPTLAHRFIHLSTVQAKFELPASSHTRHLLQSSQREHTIHHHGPHIHESVHCPSKIWAACIFTHTSLAMIEWYSITLAHRIINLSTVEAWFELRVSSHTRHLLWYNDGVLIFWEHRLATGVKKKAAVALLQDKSSCFLLCFKFGWMRWRTRFQFQGVGLTFLWLSDLG